jgi:predicted transcriptional regulator
MVKPVLMSVRPVYADAILDGTKTVELRRRRPSFGIGTQVLVYSSSPHQELRGTFDVAGLISDDPDSLWKQVGARAGIDRATFDAYFSDCTEAHAIEIENPRRIKPARLGIRPPQSYLFLRPRESRHRRLLRLVAT